jgi:hypothetical protein
MSQDLLLYTCTELISDVLQKKAYFRYMLIPRELNGTCDALAKQATTSRISKVCILDLEYTCFHERWLDIVSKFT